MAFACNSKNCVQKPLRGSGFLGAREARMQYAAAGRQLFFGSRSLVQTSRVSDTPFPGGGVSRSAERGNGPHARRAQKGRDTYGFPPSLNSYLTLSSLANGPRGPTS